jgi:hypothetical protein
MAKFTNALIRSMSESYRKGLEWMDEVEVDIPRENNVDPLLLVRTINGPKDIDGLIPLAVEMLRGQTITFSRNGKIIYKASMGQMPNMSTIFAGHPEFLELVLNVVYGLMLKKLTPLSVASKDAENSSEVAQTAAEEKPQSK